MEPSGSTVPRNMADADGEEEERWLFWEGKYKLLVLIAATEHYKVQ